MSPIYHPILLLVLAVLARWLLPPAGPGGWRTGVDAPVMLLLALLVPLVGAEWFARFYFERVPLGASDFTTYCQAVIAELDHTSSMNPQRSRLIAGFVAPLAGHLGMLDGLLLGAACGLALGVVGSYLWGHAVAGRGAAITSAALVATTAPLCLLTHAPTFYGEQIGLFLLASGLAAQALVRRTPGWALLGAGVSAALPLVDVRGLVWMLVTFPICVAAALTCRLRRELSPGWVRPAIRASCGLLAVAALAGSWTAGRTIWPETLAGTLEGQLRMYAVDTWRQGYGEDPRDWGGKVSRCAHDRGFNWGWSDPRSLPDALRCAARLSQDCAPVAPGAIATGFELQARPWFPVLMGAFCVVAVARIRRPLRLLALCVPAAPSVLALLAAIHDPDVRRLAPGFMFVPVLLGSAWALLSERTAAPDQRWARLQLPMWLGRGLRVAVVLLIVLGLIPTWLSPAAPWRTPGALTAEWMQSARGERGSTAYDAACAKELIREQAGGEPFQGNTGARWQGYPTRAPRR